MRSKFLDSQERGKTQASLRVRKGEIYVSLSDKGKGMVIMPLYMYKKVTRRHTAGDKTISWEELKESQRVVTAHARSLTKIFKVRKA